jgi:Ca2+:H+ antiporter
MAHAQRPLSWTNVVPILAIVVMAIAWGRDLAGIAVVAIAASLAGAVLAAVHHAETVAHRVGEPYGSLVLAVAVTVIEVALIVTLMLDGKGGVETLARDTVFAAVMITCNGIVGFSILAGTRRGSVVAFNAEGSGAALATVATLTALALVVPTFTTTTPGPEFSPTQLAFAGLTSLVLYGLFVTVQAGRHRDYFLPVTLDGSAPTLDDHAAPPSNQTAAISLGLLLVALVSLNLAFGSAMASIGLTIPTIALLALWLPGPLHLGLDATDIVLFVLTCLVTVLTVVPGRATLLQAGVHLALLAAYLFLVAVP